MTNPKHDSSTPATRDADPISKEMKIVAVAIFGEKLQHHTPDAAVAIANVAAAVAALTWPDNEDVRRRFIGLCLNDVEID